MIGTSATLELMAHGPQESSAMARQRLECVRFIAAFSPPMETQPRAWFDRRTSAKAAINRPHSKRFAASDALRGSTTAGLVSG